jgi:tripartite-type tricarboxylate transporter receptor subunit TctC
MKLGAIIGEIVHDAEFKGRLAVPGTTILTGSPADFGKLIADETEKWAKVIRAANIKPE